MSKKSTTGNGSEKQDPAKKAAEPAGADQAKGLHDKEVAETKKNTPPARKRWAKDKAVHRAGEAPRKPHEPPRKKQIDLTAEQKMQRAAEDFRLIQDTLFEYIDGISGTQPSDKLDSTITQKRTVFVHDIARLFRHDLASWRDDPILQHVDYYTFTTDMGECHKQLRARGVAGELKDLITEQETKWLADKRRQIVEDTFNKLAPGVWNKLSDAFKAQGMALTDCRIKNGKASVILDFRKCRVEVSVPATAASKDQTSFLTLTRYNGNEVDTNFRLPLKTHEVTALPDKIRKLVRYHL